MKKTYIFIFGIMTFLSIDFIGFACAQQKAVVYSKIDFFADKRKLDLLYLSYLTDGKPAKAPVLVNFVPEIRFLGNTYYRKEYVGQAYIRCFPKNLPQWQSRMKFLQDSLWNAPKRIAMAPIVKPMLKKIITDSKFQAQFSIYAFYTTNKETSYGDESNDWKLTEPKYPANIEIYKKEGMKWVLLKKEKINNVQELKLLEYRTLLGK